MTGQGKPIKGKFAQAFETELTALARDEAPTAR